MFTVSDSVFLEASLLTDAQTLYDLLDNANVRIVKGIRDAEYGIRDFVIADPDGNRLDIGQQL